MLRTSFAAVTLSTALFTAPAVSVASAQAAELREQNQAIGCEDAAARVNASTLPRSGAPQWSDWVTLTGCGSRGATIIAGVLRADGVRTETELSRLDQLAGTLDGWFQPQLVSAYETLLRAPDASNAMRLRAMWLLSGLYAPDVDVAGPLQGYMSARCETYERNTSLRDAPERLPESAYTEAQAAIAFAANDSRAPEYVRTTARCWEGVIRDELSRGEVVEEPAPQTVYASNTRTVVIERPVRVVYDCDNRFVFYNDVGYDLAIRYTGYSSGVLRVANGGPYVWVAGRFGPVRFWAGDTEVYYAPAVYRSCRTYGHRIIVGSVINPWYGWHAGLGIGIYIGHRPHVTRYIIPRYRTRTVFYTPRYTRPIIIGRRDNGDWNRGRNDNNGRGRNNDNDRRTYGDRPGSGGDGNRGRNDNDNRTYGTRGAEPRNATPRVVTTPAPRGPRAPQAGAPRAPRAPEASPPREVLPRGMRVEQKPAARREQPAERRGGGDDRGRGGDNGRTAVPKGRSGG